MIAQACEYASVMGTDALARQFSAGEKTWKKVCKLLGVVLPYRGYRAAA